MLRKAHNPSAPTAGTQIAWVMASAALSGLLWAFAFAGQASAQGPVTSALGSVSGDVTQTATSTTQAADDVLVPVTQAVATQTGAPTTQSAGETVTPVTKAATEAIAPTAHTERKIFTPVSKAVTQPTAPLVKTGGNVVTRVAGVARQVTAPVRQSVGKLVTPVGKDAIRTGASVTRAGSDGVGALPVSSSSSPRPPSSSLPIIQLPRPASVLLLALGQLQPGSTVDSAAASLPGAFAIPPRDVLGAVTLPQGTPSTTMVSGPQGSQPRPSIPFAPAPIPVGGLFTASGSASGFAFSIFLALAGLLMLGAPWARRRIRLASESWPIAPFVLIAERPG
jgi:hypothetical protein